MGACSSQKYKKRDSLLSLPTPSNNEQNSPGKLNQENNISKKYAKTTFVLEEINSNFFNKSQSPEKQKSIKSNIRVQLGFLKIYAIIHSNNFKIEIGSERQLKTVQHKYNSELKRMEIITKKGVQVDLLIHQISKIPLNNQYISSITEIFQDFGHFYLLQDHCSGNSLDKVSGRLTECQIARVLIQMINAIDYLHSKNMYHGQLSIDSFQFDSNKNCKLIDVKPIFEKIYPCIYQIGEMEKSKDTFQLGLIAYQLQEGNFIKNDKLSYSIDQLIFKKKISQEFKEILSKMLQNDIGQRISLQTAEFLFTQLLNKPKQSLHIIQKRKIISTILLLLKNNKILRKMQLESKDQKYITQYDLIKMFQHMDNSENIENYIEQLFEEMNIDSYQSIGIHELSTSLLNYSQRLSENKQNKQKSQQNLDESSSISCFADLLMLDEEITNNIISLIITQQFQSKDIIKKIFEMI